MFVFINHKIKRTLVVCSKFNCTTFVLRKRLELDVVSSPRAVTKLNDKRLKSSGKSTIHPYAVVVPSNNNGLIPVVRYVVVRAT